MPACTPTRHDCPRLHAVCLFVAGGGGAAIARACQCTQATPLHCCLGRAATEPLTRPLHPHPPRAPCLPTPQVVSLHCNLDANTRHLINAERLAQMKPDAVLVNAARGPCIDEAALVAHLKANPNFRAGA